MERKEGSISFTSPLVGEVGAKRRVRGNLNRTKNKKIWRFALFIAWILACAGMTSILLASPKDSPPLSPKVRAIADTLPSVLYSIATYYIDKADIQKLSQDALENLKQKVPCLGYHTTSNQFRVTCRDEVLYSTSPPHARDDYKNWSIALISILAQLDEKQLLNNHSADSLLTTLMKGITKSLDKMTKYMPPSHTSKQSASAPHTKSCVQGITTARYDTIFSIKIPRFTAESYDEILRRMGSIDVQDTGVILDLRDNFGGDMIQAIDITDAFLGVGKIATSTGRHPEAFKNFYADTRDYIARRKMVVLVNENSASASELLAAALKDAGRAVIIGRPTYGKATIQRVEELPGNSVLHLTWARLSSPKGVSWDKTGVMPHLDSRNPAEFLSKVRNQKTPPGLDHEMRLAYLMLKNEELYPLFTTPQEER